MENLAIEYDFDEYRQLIDVVAPCMEDYLYFCDLQEDKYYISPRASFDFWVQYIQLCRGFGWLDYTPKRLITSYNFALEKAGLASSTVMLFIP